MSDRRTRIDARASLAVVPVCDDHDLFADVENVFAGLATWVTVWRMQPSVTRSPADIRRIGEAAGAGYVLHGWTESERDRMRLTLELNEAASGRVLWSNRFDRPLSERDRFRGIVALEVGRAVAPVLLRRELDRSALQPPEASTAQDLALRAYDAVMQPRRTGFLAAAELLAKAEGRDGPRAATRFALVWWHVMAISQGWGGDLGTACDIATALDQGDPAAVAMAAYIASVRRREHEVASAALDRVLDGAPWCGTASSLKALTLCWLDQAQQAITAAERATDMPALGPERAWRDHVTALAHYAAGRYEDAVRWGRISAVKHPGLAANVRVLAASLAVLGRLDEAQQAAAQVLVIDPGFRIGAWRTQSLLPPVSRESMAQRLRLAGLPG